jgi:hypothetical protein
VSVSRTQVLPMLRVYAAPADATAQGSLGARAVIRPRRAPAGTG